MPSLIKRISLRFGISAPRMTIQSERSWYWRWLGVAVIAIGSYGIGDVYYWHKLA